MFCKGGERKTKETKQIASGAIRHLNVPNVHSFTKGLAESQDKREKPFKNVCFCMYISD